MANLRDRSIESRALVAAQDRLIRAGQTKERAAARLLPQQSPASAARYLRKLRTGERSGRQIVRREPIRRRLAILAPERLVGIPGPSGPFPAMVDVLTDRGNRTAKAQLPRRDMSPSAFMALPGYLAWKLRVENYWSKILGYETVIETVTNIRYTSVGAGRAVFVRLDPYKAA